MDNLYDSTGRKIIVDRTNGQWTPEMNTSYKCNCCCKEDVCKYKDEYISDCNRIKSQVNASRITEVSIKCTKFQANQVNMRGADNG